MSKQITLVEFVNVAEKMFYVRQSTQANHKTLVTVANAYSKAIAGLSGKDSAQGAASTSFNRILLNTNKDDWQVTERHECGDDVLLASTTLREIHQKYTDQGFEFVGSHDFILDRSGKGVGRKWKATKIGNLKMSQVVAHAENMLHDCFVDEDEQRPLARKIAILALRQNSGIDNLSQLWSYVYENYGMSSSAIAA